MPEVTMFQMGIENIQAEMVLVPLVYEKGSFPGHVTFAGPLMEAVSRYCGPQLVQELSTKFRDPLKDFSRGQAFVTGAYQMKATNGWSFLCHVNCSYSTELNKPTTPQQYQVTLDSCYQSAAMLAKKCNVKSIAIPCLGCGKQATQTHKIIQKRTAVDILFDAIVNYFVALVPSLQHIAVFSVDGEVNALMNPLLQNLAAARFPPAWRPSGPSESTGGGKSGGPADDVSSTLPQFPGGGPQNGPQTLMTTGVSKATTTGQFQPPQEGKEGNEGGDVECLDCGSTLMELQGEWGCPNCSGRQQSDFMMDESSLSSSGFSSCVATTLEQGPQEFNAKTRPLEGGESTAQSQSGLKSGGQRALVPCPVCKSIYVPEGLICEACEEDKMKKSAAQSTTGQTSTGGMKSSSGPSSGVNRTPNWKMASPKAMSSALGLSISIMTCNMLHEPYYKQYCKAQKLGWSFRRQIMKGFFSQQVFGSTPLSAAWRPDIIALQEFSFADMGKVVGQCSNLYQGILGRPNCPETAAILFRQDKFKPVGNPTLISFDNVVPGHITSKCGLMQLLEIIGSGGIKVAVVSAHVPWESSNPSRGVLLNKLSSALTFQSGRYIVAGDFNMDASSSPQVASIVENAFPSTKWRDALQWCPFSTSGGKKIDYIMCSEGTGVRPDPQSVDMCPSSPGSLLPSDAGSRLDKNPFFTDHCAMIARVYVSR